MIASVVPSTALRRSQVLRSVVLTWLGAAVLTSCITLLFLGMRGVLDVGGVCAVGTPFEVVVECPSGIALMMPAAIWAGFAGLGLLLAGSLRLGGPRLWRLGWTVLFFALGWNFVEFGILQTAGGPVEWTWVVSAVLFVALGAVPLPTLVGSDAARRGLLWADVVPTTARGEVLRTTGETLHVRRSLDDLLAWMPPSTPASTASTAPTERSSPGRRPGARARGGDRNDGGEHDELVDALERLSRLHAQGLLTDAEFREAKARVLGGSQR